MKFKKETIETETYGLKFRSRDFYQQNVRDPFFFATNFMSWNIVELIVEFPRQEKKKKLTIIYR